MNRTKRKRALHHLDDDDDAPMLEANVQNDEDINIAF